MIDLDKVIMKEIFNNKDDDEDGHFGASIAASLRKMEPKKKLLARIKIQQAIYEVECGASIPGPPGPSFVPHAAYTYTAYTHHSL